MKRGLLPLLSLNQTPPSSVSAFSSGLSRQTGNPSIRMAHASGFRSPVASNCGSRSSIRNGQHAQIAGSSQSNSPSGPLRSSTFLSGSYFPFPPQGSPTPIMLSTMDHTNSNLSVAGHWNSVKSTLSTVAVATSRMPTVAAALNFATQIITPSVTVTAPINPTDTQASPTAYALYSNMVAIGPLFQSLIDNPTKDKAQNVITKIKSTEPLAEVRSMECEGRLAPTVSLTIPTI